MNAAGHRSTAITLAAILVLWEVAGRLHLVAGGALPAPTAILARLWVDRGDYGLHVFATVEAAFLGFVIGNAVAIAAAILFVRWPLSESQGGHDAWQKTI